MQTCGQSLLYGDKDENIERRRYDDEGNREILRVRTIAKQAENRTCEFYNGNGKSNKGK
jgi:hypothetical protein